MSTCTKPRARAPLPSAVDRRTPSPRPSRTLETRMRGEIFHLKFRSSSPERMTRIGSSSTDDWDLRGNTDTLTMTRGAAVAACEARNARCKKKEPAPTAAPARSKIGEEQNQAPREWNFEFRLRGAKSERGAKSAPARVEFRISTRIARPAARLVGCIRVTPPGARRGVRDAAIFVQNAFGQIRTGDLSRVRRTD